MRIKVHRKKHLHNIVIIIYRQLNMKPEIGKINASIIIDRYSITSILFPTCLARTAVAVLVHMPSQWFIYTGHWLLQAFECLLTILHLKLKSEGLLHHFKDSATGIFTFTKLFLLYSHVPCLLTFSKKEWEVILQSILFFITCRFDEHI